MEYKNIDNSKEIYLLNKEIYKNIFDEYDKNNDKIYKIIPTITVIITVLAYIINWMLSFYKNCNNLQSGMLILMGVVCLNIIIICYEIIKNVSYALQIKSMTLVKSNLEHSEYYRQETLNILYKDFIEEYIKANDNNYEILNEKIEHIKNFYEQILQLIKAISVLFILYIISNIIK